VRKAPRTKSPPWDFVPLRVVPRTFSVGHEPLLGWGPRKVAWPPRGFTPRPFTGTSSLYGRIKKMLARIQIFAILGSLFLLFLVFHLVRTKRLRIQYSLLWFLTALILLFFSIFRDTLNILSYFIGIYYSPTFFLLTGFMFLLLILLHFSVIISKLSETNRELTQRLSILTWKYEQLEKSKLKS